MRSPIPTLLVLSLSGCTLFEVEPELLLVLESAALTSGPSVTVRVEWPGGGVATVLVDGRYPTDVRVGTSRSIRVDMLADGTRKLHATIDYRGRLLTSNTATVRLDRKPPTLNSYSPGWGPVDAGRGFTVIASFSEPVTLLGGQFWGELFGQPFGASPGVHGTTIAIAVPAVTRSASASIRVSDDAGNQATFHLGDWSARGLDLFVASPGEYASGVVTVVAYWQNTGPAELEVQLDGAALGTLSREGSLSLDTRTYPEGPHVLTFLAPGYVAVQRLVTFDNTPPTFLRCGGFYTDANDMIVGQPIVGFLTDPSVGEFWVLVLEAYRPATLPATWTGEVPASADAAGNVAGPWPCAVGYQVWRTPLGNGAVDFQPAPEPGLSVTGAALLYAPGYADGVGALTRFAGVGGGHMFESSRSSVAPWRHEPTYYWDPGAALPEVGEPVLGFEGNAWLERTGDSVEVHATRSGGSLATLTAVDPVTLARPCRDRTGWVETTAAGEGRLQVKWGRWAPVVTLGSGEGSHVTGAALVDDDAFPGAVFTEETPPTSPAQLREQRGAGAPGPSLNLDPAADASDPLYARTDTYEIVAWLEGGSVVTRSRPIGEADWGAPVVANADGDARLPALWSAPYEVRAVLAFVEPSAGGDVVEFRAFDNATATWSALPSLDTGSTVDALSLAWPGVLWRTTAGAFLLRAYNE